MGCCEPQGLSLLLNSCGSRAQSGLCTQPWHGAWAAPCPWVPVMWAFAWHLLGGPAGRGGFGPLCADVRGVGELGCACGRPRALGSLISSLLAHVRLGGLGVYSCI